MRKWEKKYNLRIKKTQLWIGFESSFIHESCSMRVVEYCTYDVIRGNPRIKEDKFISIGKM
jgi:hypothetical protein